MGKPSGFLIHVEMIVQYKFSRVIRIKLISIVTGYFAGHGLTKTVREQAESDSNFIPTGLARISYRDSEF